MSNSNVVPMVSIGPFKGEDDFTGLPKDVFKSSYSLAPLSYCQTYYYGVPAGTIHLVWAERGAYLDDMHKELIVRDKGTDKERMYYRCSLAHDYDDFTEEVLSASVVLFSSRTDIVSNMVHRLSLGKATIGDFVYSHLSEAYATTMEEGSCEPYHFLFAMWMECVRQRIVLAAYAEKERAVQDHSGTYLYDVLGSSSQVSKTSLPTHRELFSEYVSRFSYTTAWESFAQRESF